LLARGPYCESGTTRLITDDRIYPLRIGQSSNDAILL
jgi:hypothetical protein